jgi:hypothetical protein
MDGTALYKEKVINDYMSLVDLKHTDKLDYKKIELELAQALGERPAVEFKYEDDIILNEDGKDSKRVSKLETINIYYTIITSEGIKYNKLTYKLL